MRFVLVLLLAPLVFSQAPKRLEFEVASVRPAAPNQGQGAQTPAAATINPQQIRLNYLTMQDFITRAYGVRAYQVIGPDWLKSERYDISATIPQGATTAQVPAMMQSLLEDRFGIKVHKSKKEFSVYMLTRGKKPFTLTEVQPRDETNVVGVAAPPRSGQGLSLNVARGGLFSLTETSLEGKGVSMDVLANALTPFIGMPTMNSTDIKGFYDFRFDITAEDSSSMMARAAGARGVAIPLELQSELDSMKNESFLDALDKAGLKLEKSKAQLDVVNIDELKKLPTEN
jgi:uncharacterized protein (TIGR03435 family)